MYFCLNMYVQHPPRLVVHLYLRSGKIPFFFFLIQYFILYVFCHLPFSRVLITLQLLYSGAVRAISLLCRGVFVWSVVGSSHGQYWIEHCRACSLSEITL